MSTVMKNRGPTGRQPPTNKPRSDKQLRRDRRVALTVWVLLVALLAFVIWLASMSTAPVHQGIDYWPMMP